MEASPFVAQLMAKMLQMAIKDGDRPTRNIHLAKPVIVTAFPVIGLLAMDMIFSFLYYNVA
jgi:hypothetical protein